MKIRGMAGLAALSFVWMLPMAAFLTGSALCEEAKHPEKPLLWKIEGNGLAKPSYLFGTIHIGTPEVLNLHPAAKRAFDSADVVYTEVTMDEEARKVDLPLLLRKDGKTLSESIGKELSARFEEELKLVDPDLEAERFDPLVTWMTAIVLPTLPDLMDGNSSLDQTLWERAVAAGKKTGALETLAGNAAMFEEMGEKAQIVMLSATMDFMEKCRDEKEDPMERMGDVYQTGDMELIRKETEKFFLFMEQGENGATGKLVRKGLLDGRNVKMAAVAASHLKEEPNAIHFFAAGAAHFATETGIGDQLQKAGYTVTRITE